MPTGCSRKEWAASRTAVTAGSRGWAGPKSRTRRSRFDRVDIRLLHEGRSRLPGTPGRSGAPVIVRRRSSGSQHHSAAFPEIPFGGSSAPSVLPRLPFVRPRLTRRTDPCSVTGRCPFALRRGIRGEPERAAGRIRGTAARRRDPPTILPGIGKAGCGGPHRAPRGGSRRRTTRARNRNATTDEESTVKLQVALDVATLGDALSLAHQAEDYVDVLELGTPLIKAEGLSAITAIKAAHPNKLVFADMKTADAGELEADLAFSAGADLVTVMGAADDDTVRGAVAAGEKHGKDVVADMITIVADRVARIREVSKLGVSFVEIHAGLDEQAKPGYTIETLLADGRQAGVPFSIAGGVTAETIAAVQDAGATVAVAGGAIRSAADPAAAAKALKSRIR
ncbi:orotidine 5'-phosphate decarboxylase [Saccharopolyspora sp. HNM0986]|nr:orotidine 5'-phosphate decarboxylase [Saccharopolyspora sp. HNM0986]